MPYTVNDPDLGLITVVNSYSWLGREKRDFINSAGALCSGFWSSAGVLLGQPIRFKDSGGRIAADFPGVSDSYFVTNGDHGGAGSISNG